MVHARHAERFEAAREDVTLIGVFVEQEGVDLVRELGHAADFARRIEVFRTMRGPFELDERHVLEAPEGHLLGQEEHRVSSLDAEVGPIDAAPEKEQREQMRSARNPGKRRSEHALVDHEIRVPRSAQNELGTSERNARDLARRGLGHVPKH